MEMKVVSNSNLEKYTELIKDKLEKKMNKPENNGESGNILATDGNGVSYWTEQETIEECSEEELKKIFLNE